MTSGRSGPSRLRETVTGALWPLPTAAIVLAVVLGSALPVLDEALQADGGQPLAYVFGGGPSAARGILSTIAGSVFLNPSSAARLATKMAG